MSSLIIGELGIQLPNATQSSAISNKTIYEKYLSDYTLSSTDSIFYDSKGQIYLEFPPSNNNNSDIKYYIYTKSIPKKIFSKNFEDSIQKILSTNIPSISINPNNLPNAHSTFSILEKNSVNLKLISPNDIKLTFESMLESFENFKVLYKTIKLNCLICEKIKECYQYQYCGINSITKNANNALETCETAYQSTERKYHNLIEIKNSCIKILDESIGRLKRMELHPKMQSSNKKFLSDYYFDEEKMNSWKDTCVEEVNRLNDSINEKSKFLLNEKNKLKNEENTSIVEIKNEWNSLGSKYEKAYKEFDKMHNLQYNEISNEFLEFKRALSQISDIFINDSNNLNSSIIENSCRMIYELKVKYSNKDKFIEMQSISDKINDIASKMKKSMEKLPIKINQVFLNLNSIAKKFTELTERFLIYKKKIFSLEENFSSFKNPSYFPQAYQASIEEIKRRIIFNKVIIKHIDYLHTMISKENANRKDFINSYGKYLPLKFFPNLKSTDIKLIIDYNKEKEMDTFPNLLSNEEERQILELPLLYNINELTSSNSNSALAESLRKDKTIQSLSLQIEKTASVFQKLIDDFQSNIAEKDSRLKEKKFECENLSKRLNNKLNSKLDNCPMCHESAVNSFDYQTWGSFAKDIRKKLSEKENSYISLEYRYQELLKYITQIKKTFFIHMNTVISQKNAEMTMRSNANGQNCNSDISNRSENEVQKYKKLFEEETFKYKGIEADYKLLQSKFEFKEMDYKNLEDMLNKYTNKLSVLNEKLYDVLSENKKLKNDNESLFTKSKEAKVKLVQIENLLKISNSENKELKKSKEKILREKEKLQLELLSKCEERNNVTSGITKENRYNNNKEEYCICKEEMGNMIKIKNVEKGSRCVFVPHSENVYVCINLSSEVNQEDEKVRDKYFKCEYILDLNSFEQEKRDLIVENSLIVLGTIGDISEYDPKTNNPYDLPEDGTYKLVKLSEVNYVIGFPGEELIFRNYNSILDGDI